MLLLYSSQVWMQNCVCSILKGSDFYSEHLDNQRQSRCSFLAEHPWEMPETKGNGPNNSALVVCLFYGKTVFKVVKNLNYQTTYSTKQTTNH